VGAGTPVDAVPEYGRRALMALDADPEYRSLGQPVSKRGEVFGLGPGVLYVGSLRPSARRSGRRHQQQRCHRAARPSTACRAIGRRLR